MKKISLLIIFVIIFVNGYTQENIKHVTVLHWNDFHARDLPYKVSKKDSITGETKYYYVGGTASMLGYLNKLRTSSSLVLNAGDDFQGTPISTITRGKSQIELLNLYKLDAFVLGNHEFDYGQYRLDSLLKLADFDYLSANIYFNPAQLIMGKSYVIKNVGGVKFGILGITIPDLVKMTLPENVSQITMLNTDSVISSGISQLKNEKCNVILLLTHEGVDADKLLAEKYYKDVDVIVGGHSHTPLYKPVIDSGVIIVQAGSYARWLGELDLKVDVSNDTIVGYSGKLIETILDSAMYDKSAADKVKNMIASLDIDLMKVIGKLDLDWRASYNKESNLGQYEADAFKERMGADIAFINGGGLRKNLMKGDITVNDMWEINPFGNQIVTFTVSGKTLLQMLINNTRIRVVSKLKGDEIEILEVSGLKYSFDSKSVEQDTNNVTVIAAINGNPINEEGSYTIATNNFIAGQFKNFFGDVSGQIQFINTGLIDRDVIIEKIERQSVVNNPLEQRITDLSLESK